MPAATERRSLYLERFTDALRRADGEPGWMRWRRERAMERFLTLGVPTRRDEEYKYTNLTALRDGRLLLRPARSGGLPIDAPRIPAGQRAIVFAGEPGQVTVRGEPPRGIRVRRLSEVLRTDPPGLENHLAATARFEDHPLCALNTALFADGVVIESEPGVIAEEPVHVSFGDGLGARHPRVLILARRNSSVRVVERHSGAGAFWRNAVTEIVAEPNARVDHFRAQLDSLDAYHTGVVQASQERDSYVSSFSLSFGAALARNDIGTRLVGSGCECSLDGLFAVRGSQHVDHHTAIDHAMPHCNSHQLYKGVLDDRARGVFNGKIFVRRDAQKTDAVQSNKNLLLSDEAEVNTKPQLEIDANDVRCTHGATIGQLDATAAFYLRSRGISAAHARNILTYAFAADALERIRVASLKEHFESLLLSRFAREEH